MINLLDRHFTFMLHLTNQSFFKIRMFDNVLSIFIEDLDINMYKIILLEILALQNLVEN